MMTGDATILRKALRHALSGEGAHVGTHTVFSALDWKLAGIRPERAPHSVYEVLSHMVYWQDWAAKWLDGKDPPVPKHASGSWPRSAAPASKREWERSVRRFGDGLEDLVRRSRQANLLSTGRAKSGLEMLQTIASHNSYHAGQVVVLRQLLGAWPPPSGGLTW
jgi:uncharacterized damage-inducible protein DinB